MSDIIQLLPDHVANQIAAGEVVQRPASVVKELLENSIDAQATQIKLIVKESGKTLIQVIDNGIGMSVIDARLCFERHATSKIRAAEDLFQLHTKGFRGEALASIAAIAHVELKTRLKNDEVGTALKIEGSQVVSQDVCAVPQGASISVRNLFYNVPARRNFLKSNPVELRHIIDEFHRVALAHPDIQFDMYHNDSDVFKLPASNLRQRIVHVFGTKTNERLVPVAEQTEIVAINGFVCKPEFAKKTRGEQFFFVNGRFIKSAYLNHAVLAAFEGLLKEKTYPSYFIYLEVNPNTMDINIHPTKTEVKFEDEHALYSMLRAAIKHSLGQFNVAPILDFNKDTSMEVPYQYKDKHVQPPKIEVDRSFNPFKEDKKVAHQQYVSKLMHKNTAAGTSWESLYAGIEQAPSDDESQSVESKFSSTVQPFTTDNENEVTSLFDSKQQDELTSVSAFQLSRKYIVTTIKSGMVIINQYRAHQRILYEQLLRNITITASSSQQLLFPLQISFSPKEISLLASVKDTLTSLGFDFDEFASDYIKIKGIPAFMSDHEVSAALEKLVYDLSNDVPEAQQVSLVDILVKSMARSLAIKTGVILNKEQLQEMVNSLFACKDPKMSPDHQIIFTTLSISDIDKNF